MFNKKKLIAAAVSVMLSSSAVPSSVLCAENHTVTIIDFNGKVMATLSVPHGQPVDFSKIDVSSLEYHIDEYTQVGFNGWSIYPSSVTEDMAIYALFIRMNIECSAVPDKTEYYSQKGNVKTEGLNVTITKYTQLPQRDENGAFITQKEIIDISDTCTAVPPTIEEAFANGNKAQIKIIPPGGNRAITAYKISYFEGLGDVNSDSLVDSSDASYILEMYAQSRTGKEPDLTQEEILVCDINRDNMINAADSSNILEFYAKSATSDKQITWDDLL